MSVVAAFSSAGGALTLAGRFLVLLRLGDQRLGVGQLALRRLQRQLDLGQLARQARLLGLGAAAGLLQLHAEGLASALQAGLRRARLLDRLAQLCGARVSAAEALGQAIDGCTLLASSTRAARSASNWL